MVRRVAADNVKACMREWKFAEAYCLHIGEASGFQFGTSSAEKKTKNLCECNTDVSSFVINRLMASRETVAAGVPLGGAFYPHANP